ncbi:MAG: polysaccharide deacetylase family protein [Sphingobacteriales bacterium]|nr:polysaccharide deacetylase family protein [Sphingobacteriales bacterium]
MYLIKTPLLLKKLYPSTLIWDKSRTEKAIYLTFDDGPIPIVTPWVLKTLKNFNAKATFFCIGDNIQKHPNVFAQLKADGHQVGNHTFNHLKGWKTDNQVYLKNFIQCQQLTQTNLFRPPYGKIKRSQIKLMENQELRFGTKQSINEEGDSDKSKIVNLKLKIIMWDVLSGDFDENLTPEKCLNNVLKHTENGSIVVFHDSLKAQKRLEYVLPKALEVWAKQGYQFKTL